MFCRSYAATAPAALALSLLAACNQGTAPADSRPVSFNVATNASTTAAAGPLTLSSIRIVAGEASFGVGDQFGCIDCQDQGPETNPVPALVDVPLDGGTVAVATEQVQPGSYPAVEISLVRPTAELLAGNAGWPADASIEVRGDYNGTPFTLPLAIEGTFRERLTPPVVIAAGSQPATAQVTITLPVASWFSGPSGPLDPTDPAQRATIEANARGSFEAPETSEGEAKASI